MSTIYSAFISSVFHDLESERRTVIECLLDHSIFPISMEHFTATTDDNFDDIKKKIDLSDIVILILGKNYGSRDENDPQKLSWTEKEFDYSLKKGKKIVSMVTLDLISLDARSKGELTNDELSQLEFYHNKAIMSQPVMNSDMIYRVVSQAVSYQNIDNKLIGWSRNKSSDDKNEELIQWQKENLKYNLGGIWHHVHFSDMDLSYFRIGTVSINQMFDHDNYSRLEVLGKNYSIADNPSTEELEFDQTRYTIWDSVYSISDSGELEGIFNTKRAFQSTFGKYIIEPGSNRGIHELSIETNKEGYSVKLTGAFYNAAPSEKYGRIIFFREQNERDKFVKKLMLKNKSKEN